MRNYLYQYNITSISGLGSNKVDDLPVIESLTPLIQAVIKVSEWQDTIEIPVIMD